MKHFLNVGLALLVGQFAWGAAGGQVQTDTTFPIVGAGYVAMNSTPALRTDGFDWASAQLVVTSVTVPVQTFGDGAASSATITVSSAPVGGIAGLQICIAGVCAIPTPLSTSSGTYTFGWDPNGVSSNTAAYIANWINGNAQLNSVIVATAPTGTSVIRTTATVNNFNYSLFTSSYNAIKISGPAVITQPSATSFSTGGSSSSYVYQGQTIYLPNHLMATGLDVIFSTASAPVVPIQYSTATVGGTTVTLGMGTTYYAVWRDANDIALATSQANAAAGQVITFVSSNVLVTADKFTITPQPIAGTPSMKWVVSNDSVNWTPYVTSTFGQTIAPPGALAAYFSSGTVTWADLGHVNASYFGLAVTAPTAGEIGIQSRITGNAP